MIMATPLNDRDFEAWKESVIGVMVTLNRDQTRDLMETFARRCSLPQIRYLQSHFLDCIRIDFMTMPHVSDYILNYLSLSDLCTLRLVCRSWRDDSDGCDALWKRKWLRFGGCPIKAEESGDHAPPGFYFLRFVRLYRILRYLQQRPFVNVPKRFNLVGAFDVETIKQGDTETFNARQQPSSQIQCTAYGPKYCAYGMHRKVVLLDTVTRKVKWEVEADTPCCLFTGNNFTLASSYTGKLTVITHPSELREMRVRHRQIWSSAITALDVDCSRDCALLGIASGEVLLLDASPMSDFDYDRLYLVRPDHYDFTQHGRVRKLFFLPRHCQNKDWMICVSYVTYLAVLLIRGEGSKRGTVVWGEQFDKLLSVVPLLSDPTVLYFSYQPDPDRLFTQVSVWKLGPEVWNVGRKDVTVTNVKLHWCADSATHILAVGNHFMMVASGGDIFIYDYISGYLLYTFPSALHSRDFRQPGSSLIKQYMENCVQAGWVQWLDGLSPDSMIQDQPLALFPDHHDSDVLKCLKFSDNLCKRWHEPL